MSVPPPKPKVPAKGVPLGDDELPTQVQPRRLGLPRGPSRPGLDGFESSDVPTNPGKPVFNRDVPTNPGKPVFTSVAPEVSKGRFHERSAAPRGVLTAAAVLTGLDDALQKALRSPVAMSAVRGMLKKDWLPLLRQVVEQAGGDGVDAYVARLLAPPGRAATTPLLEELASAMAGLDTAADANALRTAAQQVRALVARALEDKAPRALSLQLLESELDGRVEVDALLSIRFAPDAELTTRRTQAEKTLESLRQQMRLLPGQQAGGLFSNFARLKTEKRVMDAEARRRGLG
ncbi:hypothetical protein [Archangium sp.]|uniref:hypothetical protein n=1 Tax=Archangium sp. TaxID=1872627 RepID=UPI00286AC878|nr:hypothetical protein [Archangium sp.]